MDMEVLGIAERAGPVPAAAAPSAPRDWQGVLDYIETHLDGDLGTRALARAAGLDPDRFTQLFSAAVGIPPHRYVACKRLERARRQLLMS
jgi:AraC family transcriptional regulator